MAAARYQKVLVELLRKVKVEALRAVAHRAAVAHSVDDLSNQAIRRRVAKTVLRQRGVKAVPRLLFQHLDPSGHPPFAHGVGEELSRFIQRPLDEFDLIVRRGLVAHPTAANQEGVKIGNDRLHLLLRIGHEQAQRVQRVPPVKLVQNDRRLRVAAKRLEVHVQKGGLGFATGLPPNLRGEIW